MKARIGERSHAEIFETSHQASWHNGDPGMCEHLHFWVWGLPEHL